MKRSRWPNKTALSQRLDLLRLLQHAIQLEDSLRGGEGSAQSDPATENSGSINPLVSEWESIEPNLHELKMDECSLIRLIRLSFLNSVKFIVPIVNLVL